MSKWERGEGIPDVVVLKTLADMYGVTVNDFLVEHKEQPLGKSSLKTLIAKRWLVALLSAGLVWLVATVVTVVWLCGQNRSRRQIRLHLRLACFADGTSGVQLPVV